VSATDGPDHASDDVPMAAPASLQAAEAAKAEGPTARRVLELVTDPSPSFPPPGPIRRIVLSDRGRSLGRSLARTMAATGLATLAGPAVLLGIDGHLHGAALAVGGTVAALGGWTTYAAWRTRRGAYADDAAPSFVSAFRALRVIFVVEAVGLFLALALSCFAFSIIASFLALL